MLFLFFTQLNERILKIIDEAIPFSCKAMVWLKT